MPSTVLSDIRYDAARRVLVVTFRPTGRRYAYAGVSSETWEELRRAFAKGAYFRPMYQAHQRLGGRE